ncbi:hypothetical protein BpHYR1_041691 [Brachionus plicatilis]|uniref:Uncharacterized protein n=1 Tax=Brachionus plicatilis TaxID=10195 RepID=A0A3M7S6K9_BRAPC|nr:hypothetical protein BpHYR1_041691 [Brachionus plicatilis]
MTRRVIKIILVCENRVCKNQSLSDVHYTDDFLRSFGRSARRSNFWTAKINGLKYTGGQKIVNLIYLSP